MVHFSIRQKTIIGAGILLCGIAAIIVAVGVPSIVRIRELHQAAKQIQADVDSQYEKVRRARESLANLAEYQSLKVSLPSASISSEEQVRAFIALEDLAAKNSIEKKIDPKIVSGDKKEGATYQFAFTNSGTFENHLRFLEGMNDLPYLFAIDRLEWQTNKSNSDKPITLRFIARIYVSDTP